MLNLLGSIVPVCHETGFAMNTVNNRLDSFRLAFPRRWAVLRSLGTKSLGSWNRDSLQDPDMRQLSHLDLHQASVRTAPMEGT